MSNKQPPSQSVIFQSEGHKARFAEAIQRTGKLYRGVPDEEYGAALLLLTANAFTWRKVSNFVKRGGISFGSLLEETDLSGGESVVVRLAGNLFNGMTSLDPLEFLRLDALHFEVALQALRLRRTPMRLEEWEIIKKAPAV